MAFDSERLNNLWRIIINYVFVGGTGGIGKSSALAMAQNGARILVVGRNSDRARQAVDELKRAGATSADWLQADLGSRAGIAAAAKGILSWSPIISGLVHSAMTVDMRVRERPLTADGFEHAFGLQYLARAALNIALADALAASGDGRIVHVGAKPPKDLIPDFDDLQFERKPWKLTPALMSSQVLGFLHAQEAAKRWADRPVRIAIACVGPTATEVVKRQPWWVKAIYSLIATTPERSSANVVRYLSEPDVSHLSGVAFLNSKRFDAQRIDYAPEIARRAWDITEALLR
ncbi:TPA: SDR family NAD(P)-dependent oxidoreductase [Klebsiella variicola subsp. variicola]|nr:SDR family NAD(P)-dependent oxidoreductase [Klebsiella variicola subsp. variicola]